MPRADLSNVIKHLLFTQFFSCLVFSRAVGKWLILCFAHSVHKIQIHQSSLNSHSKSKKKAELCSMSFLNRLFPTSLVLEVLYVPFSLCYLFQILILGPVLSLANTTQSWHLTSLKISSVKGILAAPPCHVEYSEEPWVWELKDLHARNLTK